ncbi:ABC transporter substrate-binding protein [Pseudonocardia sp. RS010]|uniref:ABC transporter substrate-binding protein n=1 Tax=Pseudonocardia sp. RS010 TaxID=3385979 RepID=UPI0039A364A6
MVGVGQADAFSAVAYAAKLTGEFDKAGVDVQFKVGGTTTFEQLELNGTTDVSIGSGVSAMAFTAQGRPTQLVYQYTSGRIGGFVYGGPGINSIQDCKNVVTGPANTSQYGFAVAYKRALNLSYNITPADPTVAAPGLSRGTYDCGIGNPSTYGTVVADGKAKVVVDAKTQTYVPPPTVAGLHGLTTTLQQKKDAVERFIKAYDATWKSTFNSGTFDSGAIADILMKDADYAATPRAGLVNALDNTKPFLYPDAGYFYPDNWPATLEFFQNDVGLPSIKADDPKIAYDKMVDMSYYKDALGDPPAKTTP